ncbi:hypothetical protein GCM10018953_41590 [Streptosporangium nondiastaticum]
MPGRRGPADDPGVVDQHVDRAQPLGGLRDPPRVGQVEDPARRPPAGPADLDLDLVQVVVAPVQHQVGPGGRQAHRDRPADPGPGAGDERGPALQREHQRISPIATCSMSSYAWFSPPIAQTKE